MEASLWKSLMGAEHRYLPPTAAAARAASTHRPRQSRSAAAVAAAAIPPVLPLHVPPGRRKAAPAPQMTCSLTGIKTVGIAHRCPSMPPLPNPTTATCSNGSPPRDASGSRSLRKRREPG
ncbi:hypothetical protein GDO81_020383 [Engystomops pustulosus]|uniref:Uncharacterized protein n=1 Tax=Engystomops pustulosus TaxID=76066 RepID=A0AAV6Z8G9_ENGPU|nr:hypothetical protein GDO81_020383 [Engystomops pustulosus]